MKPGPLRKALGVTALLVLVVVAASAFIRLSQAGLGCMPWPACYAQQSAAERERAVPPAAESGSVAVARGIHRVAATAVGLLLLGIVLAGWDKFNGAAGKSVALAALALTAFLAWLGRYTPSDLPAVVLGNMVGGMLLFGLLWSLAGGGPALPRMRAGGALGVALALLALQMALGGVLSARRALLQCTTFPLCEGNWWPAEVEGALFNPFTPGVEVAENGAALVLAHRHGAVIAALAIGFVAYHAVRAGGRMARIGVLLFVLLAAQALLGAGLAQIAQPLPPAVLHNLGAALLLATLVSLSWPKEIHES